MKKPKLHNIKAKDGKLLFHHCTSLSNVFYGEMISSEKHTKNNTLDNLSYFTHYTKEWREKFIRDDILPNQWLQEQCGFYPLFVAVGSSIDDIGMTGYGTQFKKRIGFDGKKNIYMKKICLIQIGMIRVLQDWVVLGVR